MGVAAEVVIRASAEKRPRDGTPAVGRKNLTYKFGMWGTCDLSGGCTCGRGTADRWSVAQTTMRPGEVVMLQPDGQVRVAFLGVAPKANVSPFAQGGLDEAFGLAVGARGVRMSEPMANLQSQAVTAELVRAIATSVVGEQATNADPVLRKKDQGLLEKSDGGGSLLIGQHLGEG